MPDGLPTYDQIERLGKKLDDTIVLVQEQLMPLVSESNRRSKTAKWIAVVGICVGIVGGLTAFYARDAANTNQRAIDDIEAQRTESRKIVCDNFNDQLDTTATAVVNVAARAILALVPGADSPDDLTADQHTAYDAYRTAAATEAAVTLGPLRRDCTPEGIAAFYENRTPPTQETTP